MARIIWTAPALSDLNKIADFIALDNRRAARHLARKVFATVERLQQFPESGRIPPELEASRYREVISGPCRIFYRVQQETVYIIHVMRGERERRKYLIDERALK